MEELKGQDNLNQFGPVQPLDSPSEQFEFRNLLTTKAVAVYIGVVVLGIVTGWTLFAYKTKGTTQIAGKDVEVVKTEKEEGVKDAATFKDTASGEVVGNDGKLVDEGTHILKRGDASQNVYLTSSVIDLSKYEGKKVQVWGETYKGQKAGWLMDVGRVRVE